MIKLEAHIKADPNSSLELQLSDYLKMDEYFSSFLRGKSTDSFLPLRPHQQHFAFFVHVKMQTKKARKSIIFDSLQVIHIHTNFFKN